MKKPKTIARFGLEIDLIEYPNGIIDLTVDWVNTGVPTPAVINLTENFLRRTNPIMRTSLIHR